MTSIWLRDFAAYALQVFLLISAGGLLARLFRFRASTFTLVYWQGLLAVCLVLPVCQRWKAAPAGVSLRLAPAATAIVNAPFSAASAPAHLPPSKPWPVEQAVLMVILGGIVMRGLWLATGFRGLARLRRNSAAPPAVLRPVLAEAEQEVGVRADFRTSKSAVAAITFGLRNPIIFLPVNLSDLERETQRAIVYHELLHVRRRDWTWCLAEEFVRTVFWFHPAVWWLVERIHLTREQLVDQSVIEMIASRERYVEALLTIAQAKVHARLIPAPLFLRRGLLKKRVAEILKETTMSTRRLILCLSVSAGALFLVMRAATSIFPLRVQAQELSSAPIQVVQGSENLLRRAPLVYPRRAVERHVEGDVVLEASVDEQGEVSDARVLSGPEELRRACLQSVLEWRYQPPKTAPASTQVMIHFQLPADGTPSEIVLPPSPGGGEGAVVRYFVMSNPQAAAAAKQKMKELEERLQSPDATAEDKEKYEVTLDKLKTQVAEDVGSPETRVIATRIMPPEAEELKAKIADPATSPEDRARLKKELAERLGGLAAVREEDGGYFVSAGPLPDGQVFQVEGPVNDKLITIRAERVPQASMDALSPRLGVHVGDVITKEMTQQIHETVSQTLGEQFRALFHPTGDGGVELVIVGP
jgi:TonB family protein